LLTSIPDTTARSVGAASVSQVRTSAMLLSRSGKFKVKCRSDGLKLHNFYSASLKSVN